MGTLSSIIESYDPPSDQTGVPLRSTIEVQFDRVIDEDSARDAIFLEGPDYDAVIGPNSRADEWPTFSSFEQDPDLVPDYLTSAGYQGLALGDFTFDHAGSKTLVTFTPEKPLAPSTEYTAHVTDVYSLSIGDTVDGPGNNGNGVVSFTGTWDNAVDTVGVRITTSGVHGIAQFIWWLASDPLNITGPLLTSAAGRMSLDDDNLYVHFESGNYYEDDEFSVPLSVPTLYSGHLTWDFTSGTGSVEAMPSTSSTSVISYLYQQASSSLTPLSVVSTTPEDHDAQVDVDLSSITITFNKAIDSATVTDAVVEIVSQVTSSHPSLSAMARGVISKRMTVSDKTITITL